jgi:hypothetical protein
MNNWCICWFYTHILTKYTVEEAKSRPYIYDVQFLALLGAIDHKTREIKWLIGSHSPLSLKNKILIYKTVLKPVWTYGIALWGCASNSNIETIQRYQSKLLRTITKASWYVTNHTPHADLHIPYVREFFQERIAIHRTTLASHPNPLMEPLLRTPTTRRLK